MLGDPIDLKGDVEKFTKEHGLSVPESNMFFLVMTLVLTGSPNSNEIIDKQSEKVQKAVIEFCMREALGGPMAVIRREGASSQVNAEFASDLLDTLATRILEDEKSDEPESPGDSLTDDDFNRLFGRL